MTAANVSNDAQFLTKHYVENFLKKHFNDSTLEVLKAETKPAAAKGESYCSVMTRMKIDYKVRQANVVQQIDFIVKCTYDSDSMRYRTLQKYDVFNTEMEMYEKVFPQLQQLLHEIGDSDELCAKTIHVDYERNVIVLEDLSVRNFVMANRLVGMDEELMRICLRKLAKMHATAAVLNERQSGCLEKYSHGIFNRHVNCYGIFFENMFGVCAKFADACPELGSYYGDKLLKLVPYVAEYATCCYDTWSKHFFTLNHGDMWTNNFMVQHTDEPEMSAVQDVLLIDFQYCNWTHPAIDIYYLFNTSLEDELLLHHQSKLIQYYHSVLVDTLSRLNYKRHIPTLHELNVQLLERGFYAVIAALVNLPLMINDKTEDADFDCIIGSDDRSRGFHNILYSNERVHRILKVLLPRFDRMGLLDVVC